MTDEPTLGGQTRCVVHDAWDVDDLKQAGRELRALGRARKRVREVAETGSEAFDDLFFMLLKADPHLVEGSMMDPAFVVNRFVAAELMAAPSLQRLRVYSVGDLFTAAQGAVDLAATLESIFDRLSGAQHVAAHLARVMELRATAEGEDQGLFDAEVNILMGELEAVLSSAASEVASQVVEGLAGAVDGAEAQAAAGSAWGMSRGQLSRLPAKDRLALARRLNTDRTRRIADLFGRLRNSCWSTPAEEVVDEALEPVDVGFGGDLSRVVASEMLRLTHPLTEHEFLARLAEGELLVEECEQVEDVGRGGIVMCIDGSGSMGIGDRDLWAKAMMLVLLNLAREQRREMHVIHFGYREHRLFSFASPTDFTAERILDAAETFWSSGTDFEWPMEQARVLLGEEFERTGHTTADVVFVTDDECLVSAAAMARYRADMAEMGARTWGLMVGDYVNENGPLWQMCDGHVLTVTDLTSGRDVRSLWAGVR